MGLFPHLIFGFVAAFIGVIPPGLLNISAAKISMQEGRKSAATFAVGVGVTVLVQTYIALLFARYLEMHPEIIQLLRQIGLGIFLCLTVYFFFIAKDSRRKPADEVTKTGKNRFFLGMLLAALNLLPLPYWVYISITFNAFGWFEFTPNAILLCVLGSVLGTLAMLGIYIQFFKHLKKKQRTAKVNMNYVIGAITGIVSILTLIKIISNLE
jgi:threonine/homoserine/homoserine lactone efflux protein